MKMIKQSHEILNISGSNQLLELAGRTCYKSEDKITDDSANGFVDKILNQYHHESVIEHSLITVKFITNRGVTHELVRHRLASYSQECLSGDTVVHKKGYTIKNLYDRQIGDNYEKTHNKTINLKSMNSEGKIVSNKFNEIFYKGTGEVYEVTTKLGYKIKTTLNHKFLNINKEFVELSKLVVGDKLYINGRHTLLKISDNELIKLYNEELLSPNEIGEKYNINSRSVIRRLKQIGIFISRKNDKNKEKYNKNHTVESYNKARKTIKEQYNNGRVVWNKGVTEHENTSVKRQASILREYHHNNQHGKNNSNWKGGPIKYLKARILKKDILNCELCGSTEKLEVHHIDTNQENNNINNLIKVCVKCHNLLHHGWFVGTKAILDEIISINYIGIEDVYDIEMKQPYHNYVANGFIVHNSTRYVKYNNQDMEFIYPVWFTEEDINNTEHWLTKSHSLNKTIYASIDLGIANFKFLTNLMEAESTYNFLMENGWKAQQAREVLPNALKTEIVVSANFREWRHIFKMRTAKNAHPQIRELMLPLLEELKQKVPVIFDDITPSKLVHADDGIIAGVTIATKYEE